MVLNRLRLITGHPIIYSATPDTNWITPFSAQRGIFIFLLQNRLLELAMLRRWPIACLLCLTIVMAGLAIAREPVSSSYQQSPAVAVLLSPSALPFANPQRQIATTHISLKRSIGSTLPARCHSLPSFAATRHLCAHRTRQPLLSARGIIDYRAPPSPRSA